MVLNVMCYFLRHGVSGRRSLRTSGTNRLVVHPSDFLLSAVDLFRLPPAAKIWNALSDSLVSITSLQSFRRHLTTFIPTPSGFSCSTAVDIAVVCISLLRPI